MNEILQEVVKLKGELEDKIIKSKKMN